MGEQIHTLAHRIDWSDIDPKVKRRFMDAPKYFCDADVVDIIKRSDALMSIKALVDSDVFRLPFPEMVIEFSTPEKSFRWFIMLKEIPDEKFSIGCEAMYLHSATDVTMHSSRDACVTLDQKAFNGRRFAAVQDAHASIVAITMALLFLNTRGIEKQHVIPEALNKAREKRGLSKVPPYTVLRIGTVFDRNGNAVKGGGTGHKMRVHLRAGYARRQHYGPNNSLTKMVHIPSCLVNYVEGGEHEGM